MATQVYIDNGACYMRCGVRSGADPLIFPNYGLLTRKGELRCGSEAVSFCSSECEVISATTYGFPSEWRLQTAIWKSAFQSFDINYENSVVYLSLPPFVPRQTVKEASEVIFEHFKFAGLAIGNSGLFLSNLIAPDATCLAIDIGFTQCTVYPVLNGKVLSSDIRISPIGMGFINRALTQYIPNESNEYTSCACPVAVGSASAVPPSARPQLLPKSDVLCQFETAVCLTSHFLSSLIDRQAIEKRYCLVPGMRQVLDHIQHASGRMNNCDNQLHLFNTEPYRSARCQSILRTAVSQLFSTRALPMRDKAVPSVYVPSIVSCIESLCKTAPSGFMEYVERTGNVVVGGLGSLNNYMGMKRYAGAAKDRGVITRRMYNDGGIWIE